MVKHMHTRAAARSARGRGGRTLAEVSGNGAKWRMLMILRDITEEQALGSLRET